jgi:hypothetical protein
MVSEVQGWTDSVPTTTNNGKVGEIYLKNKNSGE